MAGVAIAQWGYESPPPPVSLAYWHSSSWQEKLKIKKWLSVMVWYHFREILEVTSHSSMNWEKLCGKVIAFLVIHRDLMSFPGRKLYDISLLVESWKMLWFFYRVSSNSWRAVRSLQFSLEVTSPPLLLVAIASLGWTTIAIINRKSSSCGYSLGLKCHINACSLHFLNTGQAQTT